MLSRKGLLHALEDTSSQCSHLYLLTCPALTQSKAAVPRNVLLLLLLRPCQIRMMQWRAGTHPHDSSLEQPSPGAASGARAADWRRHGHAVRGSGEEEPAVAGHQRTRPVRYACIDEYSPPNKVMAARSHAQACRRPGAPDTEPRKHQPQ